MAVKKRKKGGAPSDFEKKLFRYALAGSAVLGVPAISHASVITTVEDQTITAPGSFAVDFNGDGITDFTLNAAIGPQFADVYVTGPYTTSFVGSGPDASALTTGATISSASSFGGGKLSKVKTNTYGKPFYFGNWDQTGTNPAFLGVQFDIAGTPHYGWAEIVTTVSDLGAGPLSLTQFAAPTGPQASAELIAIGYETSGGPITIGSDVPEPSSLALFAIGALGIVALKRRRKSA